MDIFTTAFANNFYTTSEYAAFCSRVTNVPVVEQILANEKIFTLGRKNIAISNYSQAARQALEQQRFEYRTVLSEDNYQTARPSVIEYAIFHKTTYEDAVGKYRTSFAHGLREGKKFPHQATMIESPSPEIIQKIYGIYRTQMQRKNSFFFAASYFQEFFKCPSSRLFLIEYMGEVIAYFCCNIYKDNLYASIGGGSPEHFHLKPSNKLYDELIRYTTSHDLNIHLGIGEHDAGYQKFKLNAGLVCYRTEKYPNDEKMLKLLFPFTKYRLTGKLLSWFSQLFPQRLAYILMPTT